MVWPIKTLGIGIKVVIKRAGPGRLGLRKQAQTGMDGKGTRACPRSDGAPDRAVDQPSRGVIGFRNSAQAARPAGRAHASLSARLPLLLEPARARRQRGRARYRELAACLPRSGRAWRAAGAFVGRRAGGAARSRGHHRGGACGRSLHQSHYVRGWHHGKDARRIGTGRTRPCADLDPRQRCCIRRPHRRLCRRICKKTGTRDRGSAAQAPAYGERGRASCQHR